MIRAYTSYFEPDHDVSLTVGAHYQGHALHVGIMSSHGGISVFASPHAVGMFFGCYLLGLRWCRCVDHD